MKTAFAVNKIRITLSSVKSAKSKANKAKRRAELREAFGYYLWRSGATKHWSALAGIPSKSNTDVDVRNHNSTGEKREKKEKRETDKK